MRILPVRLAVCYLSPDAVTPAWVTQGSFYSVTRTHEELSVVCDYAAVPAGVVCEGPWACLMVEGPLDFSLTGILAGLTVPLADAGIPIFVVSTYRTDYLLVPERDLDAALQALRAAGHTVP